MRKAIVTKASKYFENKYGTATPDILIECTDKEAFGPSGWGNQQGNIACMLYGMRAGTEGHPYYGTVYYGKIGNSGELFHESEFEYKDDLSKEI